MVSCFIICRALCVMELAAWISLLCQRLGCTRIGRMENEQLTHLMPTQQQMEMILVCLVSHSYIVLDERDWAMPPIASHSFSVALSNTKYEDGISILRYFYRGECVSLPHPLPFLLRGVRSDVFPLYSHIISWAETESGEYRHWRLTPSLPSPSSSTGSSRVVLMCSLYILNGLIQMRMVGNTATCVPCSHLLPLPVPGFW